MKEYGIGCYVQYTLNDYEDEGLERGISPLAERVEIVDNIGKGAMI